MKPKFFKTPKDLRAWLEKNHDKETELLVGFYKVGCGKPSITWPQLVDEALAFGWIDGVRRGIDEDSYSIRLTPRKKTSNWSAVNIKRAKELEAAGLMTPAGLAAFERREENRSEIYAYERKHATLDAEAVKVFKADRAAWAHFNAQPPGYRRLMAHRVASAKKPETRARRLAELIACSRRGERMDLLAPQKARERPAKE